jgi:transketolase
MDVSFIPYEEFEHIRSLKRINTFRQLEIISSMCRLNALSAIKRAGSGHIGSSFSSMDIFVYLYFHELNTLTAGPDNPDRDVFFSSKGHDAPGLYSVMMATGILRFEDLLTLRRLNGLEGHPVITTPGIEANTGSLGMGISKAKGIAFAKRLRNNGGRVFVLTGDGELQEGQVWESLQSAAHQKLNNICAIIDFNKIQTDRPVREIMELKNLETRLKASGWYVKRCSGHDFRGLARVFRQFRTVTDSPRVLIADTVKGKGVSFMEGLEDGLYKWHSGAPDDGSYAQAQEEIIGTINRLRSGAGLGEVNIVSPEPADSVPYSLSGERVVNAYSDALLEAGAKRQDIVVLDADLSADCGTRAFERAFPERFIENGIAEQDMVSTAGGLALQGLLPIVHSFSVFLASRANEQIFNNATEGTKIIYVCNYAGLLPAGPGVSHQGVRDVSLFGALPNCIAVEPCNALETKRLLDWCIFEAKENCLLRLSIFPSPGPITLPDDYTPSCGTGTTIHEGSDAILFAYGPVMVHEAIMAAGILKAKGISIRVVNMPWLNRIDREWFRRTVDAYQEVFVMDNHSSRGGLGDTVLDALNASTGIGQKRVHKLGIEGYPACGTPIEALQYHGLDRDSLATKIRTVLRRPS